MTDKTYKSEVMQEFELHPGWAMIQKSLAAKTELATNALAVEDVSDQARMSYWQAVVRVCREIANEPKRIIQEGKNV